MQQNPTKVIATRQDLAQRLGRDESTIYRWLQRYKQGGINALLEVKTAPGKASKITTAAMEQLQKRLAKPKGLDPEASTLSSAETLDPRGFKSYGQIQQWLKRQYGIVVAYKIVHHLVRYKLKAKSFGLSSGRKLKVPRPRSAKAKPAVPRRLLARSAVGTTLLLLY